MRDYEFEAPRSKQALTVGDRVIDVLVKAGYAIITVIVLSAIFSVAENL